MRLEEPPAARAVAPGRSILVVEDNAVNALIIGAMLRRHGYDPLIAKDGREGLEMNARHRPRLVLMDLQLPRLDGFAIASEIRRASGGAGPAIVAVTASAASRVRGACEAAGFASVLAKPIVFEELIAAVNRHVGEP
ncbi:MAG: response regulator [Amaricoccus sp.]